MGAHDPNYQNLIDAVHGIVFLATPHRGSHLAETLNRFLQVSFQSPKQYVNDLQKNSMRIRDINDQFRHHANKLQLVSFFETQLTSLTMGIGKMVSNRAFFPAQQKAFCPADLSEDGGRKRIGRPGLPT